jgi:hypothetical protein
MSSPYPDTSPSISGLAARVLALREALAQVPADLLAGKTGSIYNPEEAGGGEFRLSLLGMSVRLTYPDFVSKGSGNNELPLAFQAILAYYFHTSDGTPVNGEWISFAELPDGRIYNQAFQGYSGDALARSFGLNVESFKSACEGCGGTATMQGDAAYLFAALPRLPLLVNYWSGDEDFPSTCKILFDRSVSHYLPTDVCAILGSMLTSKLLKDSTASA